MPEKVICFDYLIHPTTGCFTNTLFVRKITSYLDNLSLLGDLPVDHPDPPGLDPEVDLGVHPDEEEGGNGD